MLLLTQYSRIAIIRNGPPTRTPSGNTQSMSLFMIAVCGFADASGSCLATEARALKCVASDAITISGIATAAIVATVGTPPCAAKDSRVLCGEVIAVEIGAPNRRALRNDCTSAGLKM